MHKKEKYMFLNGVYFGPRQGPSVGWAKCSCLIGAAGRSGHAGECLTKRINATQENIKLVYDIQVLLLCQS